MVSIHTGEHVCDCPSACHSFEYDLSISQSEWPAQGIEQDTAYIKVTYINYIKVNFIAYTKVTYAAHIKVTLYIKVTYCDVPGSPCLSKMGPVYGPFFFFNFEPGTSQYIAYIKVTYI